MSPKWLAPGPTGILDDGMTKISRRQSLLVMVGAAMLSPFMGRAFGQGLVNFEKEKLVIITKSGRQEFDVELAISNRQQAQGLMFRRSLPATAGMLFDYRMPMRITMWMKNTFIPLDMIFIGTDGRVTNIAQRTVPMSEATISSKGKVRAVLEVNSGTVARLGIQPGDKIISATLGQ